MTKIKPVKLKKNYYYALENTWIEVSMTKRQPIFECSFWTSNDDAVLHGHLSDKLCTFNAVENVLLVHVTFGSTDLASISRYAFSVQTREFWLAGSDPLDGVYWIVNTIRLLIIFSELWCWISSYAHEFYFICEFQQHSRLLRTQCRFALYFPIACWEV